MAMTTRCLDPRSSLARALWPHEPNPTHKLKHILVTAKLHVIPQTEAGHTQTMYYYDSHLQSMNGIGINLLQSNESSPIISEVPISEVPISEVPIS